MARGDNPLDKAPRGLTNVLDLKTLGRQPDEFGLLLAPTFDAYEHYIADKLITVNSTMNPVSPSAFPISSQTVAGADVMLKALSGVVTIGAAAGTRLDILLGVQIPSSSQSMCVLAFQRFTPYIGGQFWLPVLFHRPFLLPAGSVLLLQAFSDAAGADHAFALRSFGTVPLT